MDISIITPTVRLEGLKIIDEALRRQTFDSFEWIIISPKRPTGIKIDHVWLKDPKKKLGDYWTIYSAYNKAIRHAKGSLIVSIQDYTSFRPDGLEKFWYHYGGNDRKLVSGVGNKYSSDQFTEVTWRDPRIRSDFGTFYECFQNDIEWNYCAVPKQAIYDVGGFDEEMNKYSSLCGLDVLDRLEMLGGYKFYLDQTNTTCSLEHGRLPNWDANLPFQKAYPERLKEYKVNPVLNYL